MNIPWSPQTSQVVTLCFPWTGATPRCDPLEMFTWDATRAPDEARRRRRAGCAPSLAAANTWGGDPLFSRDRSDTSQRTRRPVAMGDRGIAWYPHCTARALLQSAARRTVKSSSAQRPARATSRRGTCAWAVRTPVSQNHSAHGSFKLRSLRLALPRWDAPPAMPQRMHMTLAETQRVDKFRLSGKTPLEVLALLNRSRALRDVALVSRTATYD